MSKSKRQVFKVGDTAYLSLYGRHNWQEVTVTGVEATTKHIYTAGYRSRREVSIERITVSWPETDYAGNPVTRQRVVDNNRRDIRTVEEYASIRAENKAREEARETTRQAMRERVLVNAERLVFWVVDQRSQGHNITTIARKLNTCTFPGVTFSALGYSDAELPK